MERETKKIKLPVTKGEVEIKTYITGRELREINSIFLSEVNVDSEGKTDKINGSITEKAENKAFEVIVVSMTVDEVLDLPVRDYNIVVKEVDKVQTGMSAEKKTK